MRRWLLLAGLVFLAACGGSGSAEPAVDPPTPPTPPDDGAGIPDRTIASVDLGDVHFDTFDGGSIPLSEADDATIRRLVDAIIPLTDPPTERAADVDWLGDDDLVLAYVGEDGTATAWPHRILNFHEIVNVDIDGRPILVSYCPLCGSGVVFDRQLDGRELTFGNTSALYENDMVMFDRQTSSYWWQVVGEAIVGEQTGARLEVLASSTVTWSAFVDAHPDGTVLSRNLGFGRDYSRDPFVGYADRVDEGRTPFPTSESAFEDGRLSPGTLVLAVRPGDGRVVAVPTTVGPAVVPIGGDDHVIVGEDGSAVAVRSPEGAPRLVEDRVVAPDGTEIAPTGAPLDVLPSISSLWFAVVASMPDVEVVAPD
ncbi:MAG: DUF3179 domain-containing (seleno)protein [Actinomycetota bacterium]